MSNVNDMLEILKNNSSIAIPISFLISTCIALVGVLPSVFITGANILFFGPVNGFAISLLGETIGAYIIFIIYRLGVKKRAEKFSVKHKLVSRIINSEGKNAGLLICQGRMIPFIPSAAAISNVNAIATLVGKATSIALEALVSHDIINIYDNWIRLVITIIGLILITTTLRKKEN